MGETRQYRDEGWLREKYEKEMMTITDISEQYGWSTTTIQRWLDKHGIESNRAEKYSRYFASKPASFFTDQQGYEVSASQKDSVRIHRLVLIAKGEDPHEVFGGGQTHHESRIPFDNRPSNLRLKTSEEHTKEHAEEMKAARRKGKEWYDTEKVESMIESGMTQREVAEELGCSQGTVSHVLNGKYDY